MKRHFVTFFSPGTLFAEYTEKPIDSWDTAKAVKMARAIKERHGATPYGFQFTTRERKTKDLDSKVVKSSKMYYLGGKILTLAEIKARNDPNDRILISNMESNGYDRVIENRNSWKTVQPFQNGDKLLKFEVKNEKKRI